MQLHESFVVHSTLNPDLFDSSNTMYPEVRDALINIADYFLVDYLDFPIPVLDIRVVGSNASYNYNDTSDIDLHIVTNFEQLTSCPEIIEKLFQSEKSRFNKDYDILVKGREVEVYVEDVKSGATSNGIYSILTNDWVKFPEKIKNVHIPDTSIDLAKWKDEIEEILHIGTISDIEDCINRLYLMRTDWIAAQGEYSYGNQLFKDIRALGLLDELKQKLKQKKSSDLTLEDLDEKLEIKWF